MTAAADSPCPQGVAEAKRKLRVAQLARRRARPESERAAARAAITEHLVEHLRGVQTVCGYLPLASEPLEAVLLDRLRDAGSKVLVPRTLHDAPLEWAEYGPSDATGPFGIPEPTGPRLPSCAISSAHTVLVPALAVDRAGRRLGRGGGHYDRTLALAHHLSPAMTHQWIAVVYDDERVDDLPADAFDVCVTAVVTPSGGVVPLPHAL